MLRGRLIRVELGIRDAKGLAFCPKKRHVLVVTVAPQGYSELRSHYRVGGVIGECVHVYRGTVNVMVVQFCMHNLATARGSVFDVLAAG